MTKLIINTPAAAYASVIRAFIRSGFAVDEFTIYNQTLIIEISNYQDIAIGKCNIMTIAQSIYDIVTVLGIDDTVTMQHGNTSFTINACGCYAVTVLGIDDTVTMQHCNTSFTINACGCYAATGTVVSLDCVYDAVSNVIVNRIKSIRAEDLSKCYAIVRAEQLAEDIAANIWLCGCQKRIYCIDYTQYDALSLCNRLAQLGIKSYIKSNTRNLFIV